MIELSGFIIGFMGSLHCIGMCGPIVLAVQSAHKENTFVTILEKIIYHFGRTFTYAVFGFLFGFLGGRLSLFGTQQIISLILGGLMFAFGLLTIMNVRFVNNISFVNRFYAAIKSSFGHFLKQRGIFSHFILGVLNGLLPCGFVYVALAGAVALGDPIGSALFMVLFGLGTVPALLVTSLIPVFIGMKRLLSMRKLMPVLTIVFALILILRGMNLGIPFVSPKMNVQTTTPMPEVKDCCK
jgi:sulfite exporter TauE/SafE